MQDIDRFMSHVDTSGGPEACHPWTGAARGGYGRFRGSDGKWYTAHRWLLGYLRGDPLISRPVGLEDGCHRCDNPPCCNPKHLYVGTRKRNIADAVERSRLWQLRKDVCPSGHAYDATKANGVRRCRRCERLADKRTERRDRCKNGHKLVGANVLLCKNGTRKCKICDQIRAAGPRRSRKAA